VNQSAKHVSRRAFLAGGAAAVTASAAAMWTQGFGGAAGRRVGSSVDGFHLTAAQGRAPLLGPGKTPVDVWNYNGAVPGPELRVRQGDRLRVTLQNELAEGTTIHWHGVRVPNAMDGVPHLTQAAV